MRPEDDWSPLDSMGGPTPADIIADAKGVLGENNPRRQDVYKRQTLPWSAMTGSTTRRAFG